MKKVKEMLKNNETKKNIVLVVLVGVILISLGILLFSIISGSKKVTDVEKIKIKEVSNDTMAYMEYVEDTKSKEIDKYIIYALKYSDKELEVDELKKVIDEKFETKITSEQILNLGITPLMLEENIVYDIESGKYSIKETKKTNADIAAEEVIKYELIEIKKQKRNIYEVIYEKYVVKNPYEILNYRMEKNKDTEEITKYLKGEEEKKNIKKYITKENIKEVGKKEKTIKVIYELKNDNLVVTKIENVK